MSPIATPMGWAYKAGPLLMDDPSFQMAKSRVPRVALEVRTIQSSEFPSSRRLRRRRTSSTLSPTAIRSTSSETSIWTGRGPPSTAGASSDTPVVRDRAHRPRARGRARGGAHECHGGSDAPAPGPSHRDDLGRPSRRRDRGEHVGMLIASEFPIYGRFGYGAAVEGARYTVRADHARFREAGAGTMERVTLAALRQVAPAVYDRFRLDQPGSIERSARLVGPRPAPGRGARGRSFDGPGGDLPLARRRP